MNRVYKILILSFTILLISNKTKSQHSLELEKIIDSTFDSVHISNVSPDKFTHLITNDSLYEISILYNELRPILYFKNYQHLTFNIIYKGKEEFDFEKTYNNLLPILCASLPIDENHNRNKLICLDNVVDTYVYVDKKRHHIHYEDYVLNHIDKRKFKSETIYSYRSDLAALINAYQKEITDSTLQKPSNKRWTKIGVSILDDELFCDIEENLGRKNSAGYYYEINHYRFKISDLKKTKIKYIESPITGIVFCEFDKNIIEHDSFNSDSEIVNSERTNELLTIGYNNDVELTKEFFASSH